MANEVTPVSQVVTPSGIEIAFFVAPKRKYEVRPVGYHSDLYEKGMTEEDWVEVPSVTTILEVLDKPSLPWWGMKMGVDAMRTLVEAQAIRVGFDGTRHGLFAPGVEDGRLLTMIELVEIIKEAKLTVNHIKSKAGDRGIGVHDALEAWCAIGKLPDPSTFPEEERGYVVGLRAFLDDAAAGGLEAEAFEVTVASVQHGYAGRFDLLARTSKEMRVVTKVYPKWPAKDTIVPPSRLLVDLKTSKSIYTSHLMQLGGYEIALEECGYGTIDARAVLHVTADGRYEFQRARSDPQDFLAVLACYHALKRAEVALKVS